MYAELRARYHLPSQLACSVERQVAATYKGLWTKVKKNVEHRRARRSPRNALRAWTSRPSTVLPPSSTPMSGITPFSCDSQVSVGTLNGRISVPYQGYDKHIALIRQGATIGDAKLWYDRPKKTFYLLVSLAIDVPEPTPTNNFTEVVGVDVGHSLSGRDLHCQQARPAFTPGKRVTTQSQPLRTITQTLAAKRHSWRETSLEAHRAARETVESCRRTTASPNRSSRSTHTHLSDWKT